MRDIGPSRDRATATDGSVAALAANLMSNMRGELPISVALCPYARMIAAEASTTISADASAMTEEIAENLYEIEELRIEPSEFFGRFERHFSVACDAIKAAEASRHFELTTRARKARLSIDDYQDRHPNAATLYAWSRHISYGLFGLGAIETAAAALFLSEQSHTLDVSFLSALVLVAATFFITFECASHAGRQLAVPAPGLARIVRVLAAGASSSVAIAIAIGFAIFRADLSVGADAIFAIVCDPATYSTSWLLFALETGFFLVTAGVSFARASVGDTPEHRRLIAADRIHTGALNARQKHIADRIKTCHDQQITALRAALATQQALADKAAALRFDSEFRLRAHHDLIEATIARTSSDYRKAVLLAARDIGAHQTVAAADYEAQFRELIVANAGEPPSLSRLRRLAIRTSTKVDRTERMAAILLAKLGELTLHALDETYRTL